MNRPRLLVATAAASALALAACGGGDAAEPPRGGPPGSGGGTIPAVEVVEARRGALPLRQRLTGTVEAAGQVSIYPETAGRVTEVLVDDGSRVRAGDPLVRIESRTARSQLDQAEAGLSVARAEARSAAANLAELESQFRRTLLLAEDSLVSQETVETQRAQVESARAALEQAEAGVRSAEATIRERNEAVARTVVRAPIDGVVGQRAAEVGMIADGQTPLFTIGSLDRMRVEVPVSQDMIGRIVPGQRAEVRTDALPDEPLAAEVARLSPFLAEGSFSAEAQIEVESPGNRLIPGMFVSVDVFYGESDSTTVVPVSALWDDVTSGRTGVWVASPPPAVAGGPDDVMTLAADGKGTLTAPAETRFVEVEVVAEGRQLVAVDGIRPSEWVVVIGQNLLAESPASAPEARLRASSWERILRLQERQGPDVLREVMEEHERASRQDRTTSSGDAGDGDASPAEGRRATALTTTGTTAGEGTDG